MGKNSFINEINGFSKKKKAEVIKKFVEFLKEYTEPSFGSISKRDIDIKIFNIMRDLKLISEDPDVWEIINKLKLTRTKANGLIYDANIRREGAFEKLDVILRETLEKIPYIWEGNYVSIQIDNPLLRDHIKSILKKENCLSDGSFSPEIVKMKPEAFICMYLNALNENERNEFEKHYDKEKKNCSRKELVKYLFEEIKSHGDSKVGMLFSAGGILKKIIKNDFGNDVESFFSVIEEKRKENKKEVDS